MNVSPTLLGENSVEDAKWEFGDPPPTDQSMVRHLVGLALQIGIKVVFGNYCYTFGGELWHQLKGGPIGDRLTRIVSLLEIEWLK